MENVINAVRKYNEEIDLKQRFDYKFKMNTSVIEASITDSIDRTDCGYEKNIILKESLKLQYQSNSDNTQLDFWIINDWGGIYGFKQTQKNLSKILALKNQLQNHKISKENFETISSLSKLASFWNPLEYFVYDARVAYSLNWLILKYENTDGINHKYFPMPNSRNKAIVNYDMKTVLNLFHDEKNQKYKSIYFKPEEAYHAYCKLIKLIALQIFEGEKPAYLVEMLLFVIADKEILEEVRKVKLIL